MNIENEFNRSGYYAIIPAYVRYNKELKFAERLMYGEITALANSKGYCYASNSYFAKLYNVTNTTISRWISHLSSLNYIKTEVIRDEKKQVLERRIFLIDSPYLQNCIYPSTQNCKEPIDSNVKENNINNNIINTYTGMKKSFREKVFLYEFQYQNLVSDIGKEKTDKCLDELNYYKLSSGKKYDDDYAAIKKWVVMAVEEKENRLNNHKKSKRSFNFEQREYPDEFWESLYENNYKNITDSSENDMDLEL